MLRNKLLAVSLALVAAPALTAHADAVKLKLAWVFTATEISFQSGSAAFIKAINGDPASKGVLEIVAYPNGALGRVPTDQPQLIEDGVTDLAHLGPSFSPGRFPDLEVLELPGLFRDVREASAVHQALVAAGHAKSLDNFVSILAVASPPHSIHTRFPVSTLADLKGRKIRSHGATLTSTVRALGAVPVGLAISELAEAIGRGTIDGLVTQMTVIYDTKLDRVINNHYSINMGTFLVNILMNKKRFDSLPKNAQDLIRKHDGKTLHDHYVKNVGDYYAELEARVKADPKRKFVTLTSADQKAADEVFAGIQAEWAKKRPENPALLKFVKDEVAKLRGGN